MSRNGSGVYTLPSTSSFNPAVTGQSATAADWNTTGTDLASALTQSVSADGQTTITGNIPLAGFKLTGVGNPTNAQDAVTQTFMASYGRSLLAGLTLSNDSGTPNTILDIAAGACADSTNATPIIGTAFTKTTGGTWVAGTGNAGMGNALTIANSTWYHVFAIINNGLYDVYFDTSVTAANKPAGTTSFRRIGSFKTDASAHILPFTQFGDDFVWGSTVAEGTSFPSNPVTLTVPTGINVQWFGSGVVVANAGSSVTVTFSDFAVVQTAGVGPTWAASAGGSSALPGVGAQARVWTNTSGQVGYSASGAGSTFSYWTHGWRDLRGRSA